MSKTKDLKQGDYIEWRGTRQAEIEAVRTMPTGDVEIWVKGIDFNGYGMGTYSPDAEILVIAVEPPEHTD